MINTKSDLINAVKRVYPSMPNGTADQLFDETNREIVTDIHLTSTTETVTNITNGTRIYSMTNTVMGVYTCRLQNSATATDFTALEETSVEAVEQADREYLKRTGTPTHFAVDGDKVWVHPTPDFNTTNGYPTLILRSDTAATLNSNSALPAHVPGYDAWKYGVCAKYAADIGDPKFPIHQAAFENAMKRLHAWRHKRNRYVGPSVKPKAFFNSPSVK